MDDHGLPGRCLFGRCFRFWDAGDFRRFGAGAVQGLPQVRGRA